MMSNNIHYELKLISTDKDILNTYSKFLQKIFCKLNIKFKILFLPKQTKRITVLKSPHVYKKAREQFQINSFKKKIFFKNFFLSAIFIKFLYINKPSQVKITLRRIV